MSEKPSIEEMQRRIVKLGYQIRDERSHRKLAAYTIAVKAKEENKGLLLCGHCGSGKTFWLKTMLEYISDCSMRRADKLAQIFLRDKNEFFKIIEPDWYANVPECYWDMAIDDFGQETMANDYGNKLEIMEMVLSLRYDIFKSCGGRTFLTTNLTMNQIKERYGDRIDSRLHEMCVIVPFTAGDYRKGEE